MTRVLRLEHYKPKQIYQFLVGVFPNSVLSFSTITRCGNEFQHGQQPLEKAGRSGSLLQASIHLSLAL